MCATYHQPQQNKGQTLGYCNLVVAELRLGMRQARVKLDSEVGEAVYHVMTRTVNGERLLDDVAKEVLRKQLWRVADFCGVEVLTFALMSNHFHVLVRVPKKQEVSDAELLRRWKVLHPKPTRQQELEFAAAERLLKIGGERAQGWRTRQLARMGDVSMFMKTLKQRFTAWFNRRHERYGTLWAERFKSVLVESKRGALSTVAAYIDLNPVRAGLVKDPKDYRFCGYAEAVAGNRSARRGIQVAVGGRGREVFSRYRSMLMGKGAQQQNAAGSVSEAKFQNVVRSGGRLSKAEVLRCRVRHFTNGVVLGSQEFVRAQLRQFGPPRRSTRRRRPHDLPPVADWGGLMVLRAVRG